MHVRNFGGIMGVNAPCKDCIDRAYNCHSKCPKYKEFKDLMALVAKERDKYNLTSCAISDENLTKIRRKRRR